MDAFNTVAVCGDITGKPYHLVDSKGALEAINVVKDIESLGTF